MTPEKLSKLKDLLKLADSGLTRSEFTAAFKALTDFIKRAEQILNTKIDDKLGTAEEKLAELNRLYKETISKVEEDNQSTLSGMKRWVIEKVGTLFIKSQVNSELAKRLKEIEVEFGRIIEKADEIKGFEMPDTNIIAQLSANLAITEVLKQIPLKDDLKVEIPKLGDLIVDTLSKQASEEKLHIEDIWKLREELDELRQLRGRSLGGGGFNVGALDIHIADPYAPTGTIDGANTDFTLTSTPSPAASLKVYRGGALQSLTEDYTVSGTTITFLIAPVVGEIIKVEHRR